MWQFLRQIFSFDPKVHCVWILIWLSDHCVRYHNILNLKKKNWQKIAIFGYFLPFFFFFKFKILWYCTQWSDNHIKIHRQCTLASKLKICRRNCHKNQHLLIFDDFGKIFDFWPNLEFFEAYLWVFKTVGNRQTQKNFFYQVEKSIQITIHILKYAL